MAREVIDGGADGVELVEEVVRDWLWSWGFGGLDSGGEMVE